MCDDHFESVRAASKCCAEFPWMLRKGKRFFFAVLRARVRQHFFIPLLDWSGRSQARSSSRAGASIPAAESSQARLRNRKMGFVFQGTFCCRNDRAGKCSVARNDWPASKRSIAEKSLASVGLGDRMHHLPAEFIRRRTAKRGIFARALTMTRNHLADEPTGNLGFENWRYI